MVLPAADSTKLIPEIQYLSCKPEVFQTEQFYSYPAQVYIEHIHSPSVEHNDQAFAEFIQGEERYLKFISQDLTFLQSSTIPSTFKNVSNTDAVPAKIRDSHTQTVTPNIQLPTCTPREHCGNPPTTVQPLLGFAPAEIRRACAKPKLTLEQLLDIQACKEYVQTPLQTLDSIQVNQPKRFLPLAKEAQKLAEALEKEQDATQWPDKLVQESFVEQLNAIQALEQLAPLHSAREHLPQDIITI